MGWISKKLSEAKVLRALANSHEEALYARVASEVAQDDIRPGLWAKALSVADGDEQKAKARYVSFRVEQLQIQLSAAGTVERAAEISREHVPSLSCIGNTLDSLNECISALALIGCAVVTVSESEWEIITTPGVTYFARSRMSLEKTAGRLLSEHLAKREA